MALLVLAPNLLGGGEDILQGDPVLDQQTNLDVHHVQVLLHLLVRPDVLDNLCLQALAFLRENRTRRGKGNKDGKGEGKEREGGGGGGGSN